MVTNRTELALMARGIDSETARSLRESGWTVAKLTSSDEAQLSALSLGDDITAALRGGKRPSIPPENLAKALFANRWLCCICRDSSRPIIIHHIEPWSKSHDHSVDNLAVLCPLHHGEAHTTRGLETSLTAARIRSSKLLWEGEVKRADAVAIQQSTQLQSDTWLYFNHVRLLELADSNGIRATQLAGFDAALESGCVDQNGHVVKSAEPGSFMYVDSDGAPLRRYMKQVLYGLLDVTLVRNISDDLDRGVLGDVLLPDDIVYVQGLHSFQDEASSPAPAQLVRGRRSANRVEVLFTFDRREATSSSAWYTWLRGQQSVGSLVLVRKLERAASHLQITCTLLAIRTGLYELKQRAYEVGLYKSGLGPGRHYDDGSEDDSFE